VQESDIEGHLGIELEVDVMIQSHEAVRQG
jgi:hypothetical protein